jgi:hypothetical protein
VTSDITFRSQTVRDELATVQRPIEDSPTLPPAVFNEYYHLPYVHPLTLDAAIAEDVPVLKEQHAGLNSPFVGGGRYSYLEPSVANFAVWYADRLPNRA